MIILSALLGFIAPLLPDVIKLFTQASDRKHEINMFKLQLEHAEKTHQWRMEEITSQADIAESMNLHAPQKSFGVQLLDAAHGKLPGFLTNVGFLLFAVLDFLSGMVRPSITYAFFAMYLGLKVAQFDLAQGVVDGNDWRMAIAATWHTTDYEILTVILSYWFGTRAMKYAKSGWK